MNFYSIYSTVSYVEKFTEHRSLFFFKCFVVGIFENYCTSPFTKFMDYSNFFYVSNLSNAGCIEKSVRLLSLLFKQSPINHSEFFYPFCTFPFTKCISNNLSVHYQMCHKVECRTHTTVNSFIIILICTLRTVHSRQRFLFMAF